MSQTRGHYQTQLHRKVKRVLKSHRYPNIIRASYLADELVEPVNSVWYQLENLVEEGLLVKAHTYYILRSQRDVVVSTIRNLKKSIYNRNLNRIVEYKGEYLPFFDSVNQIYNTAG